MVSKNEKLIAIGAVAVAGFLLWKTISPKVFPVRTYSIAGDFPVLGVPQGFGTGVRVF